MTYETRLEDCVYQLVRLGLAAESKDVELFVRDIASRSGIASQRLSERLCRLLEKVPTLLSPLRDTEKEAFMREHGIGPEEMTQHLGPDGEGNPYGPAPVIGRNRHAPMPGVS